MLGLTSLPEITLAAAGTEQALSPSRLTVTCFLVQASPDNVGTIYIGGSTVSATNGTRLPPGYSLEVDANTDQRIGTDINLAEVYIDGSNTGDSVFVSYCRKVQPE
jgi:hypothetical protein